MDFVSLLWGSFSVAPFVKAYLFAAVDLVDAAVDFQLRYSGLSKGGFELHILAVPWPGLTQKRNVVQLDPVRGIPRIFTR